MHTVDAVDRDHAIARMFAALDEERTDDFVGFMTEDARWTFGNAETVVGREDIRKATDGFLTQIESLSHEITGLWEQGDTAIAEFMVTYTRRDGKVVRVPAANIFRIEDGLIKDFRIYMDVAPVFA